MKLSAIARAKKRLASQAEKKKVISSAKVLMDYGLLSAKRALMIERNYR
jgi:hypothetical protein